MEPEWRSPGLRWFVLAAPWRTLAFALVLLLLATWAARDLRPRADLASLLPRDSEAGEAYRLVLEEFGGVETLFVMLRQGQALPPRAAPTTHDLDRGELVLEAAWALADRLRVHEHVAAIRTGIEAEDERLFFEQVAKRAPLLLGDREFERALAARLDPAALAQRARDLRLMATTAGNEAAVVLARFDPLGFLEDLEGFSLDGDALADGFPVDALTGSFRGPGGEALVLVTPRASELDAAAGRALLETLEGEVAALAGEFGIELEMFAVGGPLYAARDERALRTDLATTLAGSAIASLILLTAAFGGLRLPLLALFALAVGLVFTAGLLAVSLGTISALALGFAAVLIGLGLDYAIHACTRFVAESARGLAAREALEVVLREVSPAILAAALTTAAAFLVLTLAALRSVRELGVLVALGMFGILLATYVVGTPLLALGFAGSVRTTRLFDVAQAIVQRALRLARQRRRVVVLAALFLFGLGAVGLTRIEVDPDLRQLRPGDDASEVSERLLALTFGLGSGVEAASLVLEGDNLDEVLERAAAVTALVRPRLPQSARLESPSDLLASQRQVERRLKHLSASDLTVSLRAFESALREEGLRPAAFREGLEALGAMAEGRDPLAVEARERLPEWAAGSLALSESGRTYARLRLRLPSDGWQDGLPSDLAAEIEALAPGTRFASSGAVGAELRSLARRDLRVLAVGSSLAVLAVVLVAMRFRFRLAAYALLPVVWGATVSLGLWGLFARPARLDLLSIAVLPILLGIGVDDGLHALCGQRGNGPLRSWLGGSIASTGRAMVLTTLTTAAGFSSLALSSIPGLERGGLLVAGGVVACLVATLLVLPASAGTEGDQRSRR